MKLSPHFWLHEFMFSETAIRMGREIEITDSQIAELTRLCVTVLEPLREALGAPIVITSGYRPQWLNRAIGGSRTSDHMAARAADLRVIGVAPLMVCAKVRELDLPIRQCIHEFGRWTHIGINAEGEPPKREYLTARKIGAETVYAPGLHEVLA